MAIIIPLHIQDPGSQNTFIHLAVAVFLTQIISNLQKNVDVESCIMDFMLGKMEFVSAIFKKLYFSKYSKGVVNRLPPFKNLSDHTNRFLMG